MFIDVYRGWEWNRCELRTRMSWQCAKATGLNACKHSLVDLHEPTFPSPCDLNSPSGRVEWKAFSSAASGRMTSNSEVITVVNVSNEGGRLNPYSEGFLVSCRTDLHWRRSTLKLPKVVHLLHPSLQLGPFPFHRSVLPTRHLFGHNRTMMSCSDSAGMPLPVLEAIWPRCVERILARHS
jgi:hypothetical protein